MEYVAVFMNDRASTIYLGKITGKSGVRTLDENPGSFILSDAVKISDSECKSSLVRDVSKLASKYAEGKSLSEVLIGSGQYYSVEPLPYHEE